MAMTEMRRLNPRWPDLGNLDWQASALDFDRDSDTLYWDFYGEPRAAISVPVTDHVLLSVDPGTEEVVGLQLDGFLAHVIYQAPELLELGDLIGLGANEIEEIRRRLAAKSASERKQTVLPALIDRLVPSAGRATS